MRCLAHFLTTKNKKKSSDVNTDVDVPFLIMEVPVRTCVHLYLSMMCTVFFIQRGTPAQEAIDVSNNHPHIVKFIDATGDISPQFFVAVEQQLLLECKSLERAIFLMVATHYVFNIEHNSKVKDVFLFLEEKIFGF